MILATDTHYTPDLARTAGVLFADWSDPEPASTHVIEREDVAEYESGSFYKRELPLIIALLETLPTQPSTIIIDGYVTLDSAGRKGLGAHLFDSLASEVPVIGVAKTPFNGSLHALSICRGESDRPLFITAAGIDVEDAAQHIQSMAGTHRLPTLLKAVDILSRES